MSRTAIAGRFLEVRAAPRTFSDGRFYNICYKSAMEEQRPIAAVRQMLEMLIGGPDTPFMERRLQAKKFAEAFALPSGLSVESDRLGGVKAEWVVPDNASPSPALLHLHGGGYVLGDPAGSRALTTALALKTGKSVVSIDYRLAPEHPFPAAVEDALSAYRALVSRTGSASRIAVGGESAGGGLTVALLLAALDAGLPMPACAFAISPWVDLTCSAETFDACAMKDPLLTKRALKEMGHAYLAGADERSPFASPVFGELQGLPPLLIQAGSDEVLLDDARLLNASARNAGVASELEVWDGMIHVWHMFHPMLPEGELAIDSIVRFVQSHWR
ncbi:MAG TPA: alpha/beta hydrolase [Rhizomicrobium sp.]|nr:alpha/beta hydrolase [Rhizomicrobium sp.]